MEEECQLLGLDGESVEILYSGTKEDCYAEFDIALQDSDIRQSFETLTVVRLLREATLRYDIKEYPEESETFDPAYEAERKTVADRVRAKGQPSC